MSLTQNPFCIYILHSTFGKHWVWGAIFTTVPSIRVSRVGTVRVTLTVTVRVSVSMQSALDMLMSMRYTNLRFIIIIIIIWLVSGIALNKYRCEYGTLNSTFAPHFTRDHELLNWHILAVFRDTTKQIATVSLDQHWKIMPWSCAMLPSDLQPSDNITQLWGIIFQYWSRHQSISIWQEQ